MAVPFLLFGSFTLPRVLATRLAVVIRSIRDLLARAILRCVAVEIPDAIFAAFRLVRKLAVGGRRALLLFSVAGVFQGGGGGSAAGLALGGCWEVALLSLFGRAAAMIPLIALEAIRFIALFVATWLIIKLAISSKRAGMRGFIAMIPPAMRVAIILGGIMPLILKRAFPPPLIAPPELLLVRVPAGFTPLALALVFEIVWRGGGLGAFSRTLCFAVPIQLGRGGAARIFALLGGRKAAGGGGGTGPGAAVASVHGGWGPGGVIGII